MSDFLAHGVQSAFASVAASQTDSVIVAAPAVGVRIRVVGFFLNYGPTTASSVTFNSKGSGAGTAISAALITSPLGGLSWGGHAPIFSTNRGEGLTVTTSAGSTTGIHVVYQLVP